MSGEGNRSGTDLQAPTRRSRFVILVTLIAVSAIAAGAVLVVNELRARERVYGSIVEERARAGGDALFAFLEPVWNGLVLIRGWSVEGELDPSSRDQLDRLFLPIVRPPVLAGTPARETRISSLEIATSEGHEYVLTRAEDEWRSTHSSRGEHGLQSTDWYRGAQRARLDGDELYWTALDLRASGLETAVIAAWAWDDGGGTTWAAALGVTRAALDRLLQDIQTTEHGFLMMTDAQGDFLRLQPAGDRPVVSTDLDGLFHDGDERALVLFETYREWSRLGKPRSVPMRVDHGGETWWFLFQPLREPFSDRDVAFVAPERDLAARFQTAASPVTYLLFGFIGLGVVGLVILAFRYRRQLIRLGADPGHVGDSEADLRALIARGESDRLEFKSTLRWNLKANKPGKEIELAWLKSVVAFLNTDGGTLLIGVQDDGSIVGIGRDGFRNEDKYLLHVDNLIHKHVGLEFGRHLSFALRPVGEDKILVLDCRKAKAPAFLKHDEEEDFYVRVGPASRKLSLSKTLEHLGKKR